MYYPGIEASERVLNPSLPRTLFPLLTLCVELFCCIKWLEGKYPPSPPWLFVCLDSPAFTYCFKWLSCWRKVSTKRPPLCNHPGCLSGSVERCVFIAQADRDSLNRFIQTWFLCGESEITCTLQIEIYNYRLSKLKMCRSFLKHVRFDIYFIKYYFMNYVDFSLSHLISLAAVSY